MKPTAFNFVKIAPKITNYSAVQLESIIKEYHLRKNQLAPINVENILKFANTAGALDGHGVEAIPVEGVSVSQYYHNIVALYVNRGDTYRQTLLFDTKKKEFLITSWGDFVEKHYSLPSEW